MMKKIFFSLLFLGFFCLNAQLVTDRPGQAESSVTVPKAGLQIETGIQLTYDDNDPGSSRQFILPINVIRFGVTDWMELRMVNKFETIRAGNQTIEGISDLEIGAKVQILRKEDVNTEIAVQSHLSAPTGNKDLTTNGYGTVNRLIITHNLNSKWGLGWNLGYNYFGQGSGDFIYTSAVSYGVNDKVGVFAETYGELENLDDFSVNFNTGFTYLLNPRMQLDFSFGTGIDNDMNFLSLGYSWLIESTKE